MMCAADDEGGLLESSDFDGVDAALADGTDARPAAVPLPQRQPPTLLEASARAQRDVGVLHTKMLAIHAEIVAVAPLVAMDAKEFFRIVEHKEDNKHQRRGACKACGKELCSTASSRFVAHIIKCPLIPFEVTQAFKALKKISDDKASGKREAGLRAEEEVAQFAKKHAAEQSVLKQSGIKACLVGAEKAWADRCIAEFFYANAIPFSVANSDAGGLYKRMITAIKATPAGYKPPNHQRISNELLDECYNLSLIHI